MEMIYSESVYKLTGEIHHVLSQMILLYLVLEVYTSCYSILDTRVLRHCRDLLILMI